MLRINNSVSFFWAANHLLSFVKTNWSVRTLKKTLGWTLNCMFLTQLMNKLLWGKNSYKENCYILNSGLEFKETFQSIYNTIGKYTHSNVFPLDKYLDVVIAHLIATSESKLSFDFTGLLMALNGNLGDLASTPGFIIGLFYGFEQVTSQLCSFNSPICEKKKKKHYSALFWWLKDWFPKIDFILVNANTWKGGTFLHTHS